MVQMRKLGAFGFALAAILCAGTEAQGGDPAAQIQQRIVSQIRLATATGDHSDLVTAGDILVLHKDGLMMCSSASSYAFSNTYSNGVLTSNYKNRVKDAAKTFGLGRIPGFGTGGSAQDAAKDAAKNGCSSRKFMAGEKFWVTGVSAQRDGVVISTFSDPYNNVRYYGEIKFPFPNGSVPSADNVLKTVSEVITVQASDAASQPAPAPAPAPMPAIAPPPPPADVAPPTIALGQTKDQVTAAFGQPVKIAKLGAKEIFYYKDMKVTFTQGKVSNVE
jgi:hypothetical protein